MLKARIVLLILTKLKFFESFHEIFLAREMMMQASPNF